MTYRLNKILKMLYEKEGTEFKEESRLLLNISKLK